MPLDLIASLTRLAVAGEFVDRSIKTVPDLALSAAPPVPNATSSTVTPLIGLGAWLDPRPQPCYAAIMPDAESLPLIEILNGKSIIPSTHPLSRFGGATSGAVGHFTVAPTEEYGHMTVLRRTNEQGDPQSCVQERARPPAGISVNRTGHTATSSELLDAVLTADLRLIEGHMSLASTSIRSSAITPAWQRPCPA